MIQYILRCKALKAHKMMFLIRKNVSINKPGTMTTLGDCIKDFSKRPECARFDIFPFNFYFIHFTILIYLKKQCLSPLLLLSQLSNHTNSFACSIFRASLVQTAVQHGDKTPFSRIGVCPDPFIQCHTTKRT